MAVERLVLLMLVLLLLELLVHPDHMVVVTAEEAVGELLLVALLVEQVEMAVSPVAAAAAEVWVKVRREMAVLVVKEHEVKYVYG